MPRSHAIAASLAVLLVLALAPHAMAQRSAAPPAPRPLAGQAQSALPPVVRTVTEAQDAEQTRDRLNELLGRYSPSLAGVLKLDPTLLADSEYLAPYPGLAEFLAAHPEVARDPAYFFDHVRLPGGAWREPTSERDRLLDFWRSAMEAGIIFTIFLVVMALLTWLIKTLIDYRRWSRLSKVQADAHNKVLDRFASNEDLLAYVQTPAGRRFLESAPIALDPAGPAVSAPFRRILFAIEAGFVILAGGIGLRYVSGRVPAEISPMLLGLGVLGIALGIGFIVAAGVSFLLSKRMGLIKTASPAQEGTGE